MDVISVKKIVDIFSDVVKIILLMGEDWNDNEYCRVLVLVEFLVDYDDFENLLFELFCVWISEYEKYVLEFKVFN